MKRDQDQVTQPVLWPPIDASWWFFMGSIEDEEGHSWRLSLLVFYRQLRSAHAFASLLDVNTSAYHSFERVASRRSFWGGALKEYSFCIKDWVSEEHKEAILLSLPLGEQTFRIELQPEKPLVTLVDDDRTTAHAYTRLALKGFIEYKDGRKVQFSGHAWYERARSRATPANFAAFSYEWAFFLLDDKTEIALFHAPWQYFSDGIGVLIDSSGNVWALLEDDIDWHSTHTWRSRTGAAYPVEWYVTYGRENRAFSVNAYTPEQECRGYREVPLRFWFGAGRIQGVHDGRAISGEAFIGVGRTQSLLTRIIFLIGSIWYRLLGKI